MNTSGAKKTTTTREASSTQRAEIEDLGTSPKQPDRAPGKALSVRVVEPAVTGGCLKPKFGSDTRFHKEVKRRVENYFTCMGLSRGDNPRMYLKTAVLLLWFGGSYALLVFGAATLWEAVPLAFSFALAWAGIGFGVQHDANHGAYSSSRTINRLMGMTLDILGGSSYIWRWKHNISHHTYTNVDGADNDINVRPFARLCPTQSRYSIHRFQHFYMWALYGFLHPQWQVEEISQLARARIAQRPFPRPRGWALAQFIAGKAIFLTWAFVVPSIFHPWWVVILFYAASPITSLGRILQQYAAGDYSQVLTSRAGDARSTRFASSSPTCTRSSSSSSTA